MNERLNVLDIGIGQGGSYITPPQNEGLYIGLDYAQWGLQECARTCKNTVFLVRATGDVDEQMGLPFPSSSFDRIISVLPFTTLLVALTLPDFWLEAYRVLKNIGKVEVIIDLPTKDFISFGVNDQFFTLIQPDDTIERMARLVGFSTESRLLTLEEFNSLGTATQAGLATEKDLKVKSIQAQKV